MSARSCFLRTLALVLGAFLVTGSGIRDVASTLAARAGQIYVAEDTQIERLDDMTGAGRTTLGTRVSGPGVKQFNRLEGIFVDGAGRIYVSDFHNSRIVRVNDMTGAGWTTLGTPGAGVKQFSYGHGPGGIFLDGAGRIYVADFGNSRIVRVNDMTGAGWTTVGKPGTGVNEFNGPAGIFVDGAGRILCGGLG